MFYDKYAHTKKINNKVLFESKMKSGKVEKDKRFLEKYKKCKILEGTKQQDYYSLKKCYYFV